MYHGLRGSASPVLTAMAIFDPPTESTPLDRSQKKIVASDYVGDPYGCAKFKFHISKMADGRHFKNS